MQKKVVQDSPQRKERENMETGTFSYDPKECKLLFLVIIPFNFHCLYQANLLQDYNVSLIPRYTSINT